MSWRFLVAYTCSGLAGLVYEVTWTRQFTLHLGHTTAAASTVVAAFLLGLAVGAAVVGRRARTLPADDARRRYVAIELGVAVIALLVPVALAATTPLLRWAYGDGAVGVLFPAVRVALAAGLVLVPAVALGATYPLAVRAIATGAASPMRASAMLYAANTLGAAAGALLAGFILIPSLGVWRTTLVAVATTALSAVLAWTARPTEPAAALSASRPASVRPGRRDTRARGTDERGRVESRTDSLWLVASVLGLSGFAALLHEIAWTRILALTIGPTTYAFAAALAAVIAGTAVGAWLGTGLLARLRQPALALALALALAAVTASLTYSLAGSTVPAYVARALAEGGARGDWVARGAWIAAALVVPTAICLGAAFPLALAVTRATHDDLSARVGLVYAVNTVGAVGGALAAGFWSIPTLGLQGTLQLACVCLIAAALLVVSRAGLTAPAQLAGLAAAMVSVVTLALSPAWDRALVAGGAYLYAPFVPSGVDVLAMLKAGSLRYYREGPSATIAVKQLTGTTTLSVDGKTDASDRGDMLTQALVAHLPLLLHDAPREVAVVGLGSGVTVGAALSHPVSRVDVIELSPEVVEASHYFDHVNGRPLADARTRLLIGDGRTHLRLARQTYDVIVSEPSNPWIAGVAALFTEEYFTEARERLAPGGVFCQWANGYNIADADLRAIARTFVAVFPDATVWLVGEHDVLLVGTRASESGAPALQPVDRIARQWSRGHVATDLGRYGVTSPFALLSLYVAGPGEIANVYAGPGPRLDDDRMPLEFSAPREIHRQSGASNGATLRALLEARHAPAPLAEALARATAADWRDRGLMFARSDSHARAFEDFARGLALAPDDGPAVAGLIRSAQLLDREPEALAVVRKLPASVPPSVERLVAWSQLLAATGALDDARTRARAAATLAPERLDGLAQLAQIAADTDDRTALAGAIDELRQRFADHPRTAYFQGALAMLDGDAAAALSSAQRAITRDQSLAAVYDLAGAALTRLGRAEEARGMFERSLSFDAHDSTAYANLGVLALASGRPDDAASRFAEAVWLDPSSIPARDGLARALASPR